MKRLLALLLLVIISATHAQGQKLGALRRMSQTARSTGNLVLERLLLSEILLISPDEGARFRLARNHFETGDFHEAIRLLTTKIGSAGNNDLQREAEALLGEAYFRSNQSDRARIVFTSLLDRMPNAAQPDDAALAAATALDLMDGGTKLAEAEHMRRANIYQFNRDFAGARLHFDAVLAAYPSGASAADAVFQIGRIYAQQRDYIEAVKWFERALEQHSTTAIAKDALLHGASAYSRFGKSKEAITRYQNYIDKYPNDERVERAYLNIVDIHRDQGGDTDALKWCVTTENAFKGKMPEALAVFAAARIHIAREDWQKALESLDRLRTFPDLGGPTVPGGTSFAEVAFLRGFVLEQLNRFADAIDVYLSVPDGRHEYYGWRATERLQQLAADPNAAPFAAQKADELEAGLKAKDADARRRYAQALLRVSNSPETRDKALDALKQAIKSLPAYKLPASKLEPSADAVDEPHVSALAAIEPQWRKLPADFPLELIPREHAVALYPAPYADELLVPASKRGIDPRLMLAIMRQESRFRPDTKSVSAARGLMQFIAPTATQVANDLGRRHFSQEDVFHAPTAILFGSHYMGGLFAQFPGQTEAVLASYNGGDDNVKRWLARARSAQPERYVPEIMFAQTKDYVVRVMANYRMYQHLYDERLQLK